jgi:formylglycine-generating enzyme required for sulfatase activity
MRIFISYSSKDRESVERVQLALRAQGHDVFFDRVNLPAGEEYDVRIREAIESSELFIFVLSENALAAGSYTLSELEIAEETWPLPAGKVLPVMLRPVDFKQIPPYLDSVTVLEPKGELEADVADAVHRIASIRRRAILKIAAGCVVIAALAGGGTVWYWTNRQPKQEIHTWDGSPAVLVPAGAFTMGDDAESPRREVYLDAFYLDKYQVTTARFGKFLQATGSLRPPDGWDDAGPESNGELPVIGVDWNDADAYCHWAHKRLPTEAEWEKAARGTDARAYPWGNDSPDSTRASFGRSAANPYRDGLTPVGSHPAGKSPYGAHDLAGNASEWVADWFSESFPTSDVRNPKGPATGEGRVIRGSGWDEPAERLLSTKRYHASPGQRLDDLGFRCAQAVP